MKKVLKHILYVIIFFIGMLINPSFAASNSANIPVVVPGLTPVKYNAGNWEVTTNMDSDWYDYENGVWANARTNNGYQYVWIPRFTYKIEGEKISIKWSDGKNDDTTDGYLRHPAFYFGEYIGGDTLSNANFIERNGQRNELTGFWIQKDLFSTNITSVSNAFNNSIKMTQNTAYGLPQSGTYTHMTKASEWGALVYLTQAKGRLTGGTRTTLNQTGVNIGSAQEYVLGLKGSPSTNIDILSPTYKRYRDVLDNSLENYYGYAISETKGLANTSGELSENSFLVRGGSLGLFGYVSGNGNDSGKGYRTSISVVTEELTDTIAFFDTETSVVSGDYLILGVDFYVQENWKFPANPVDFFVNLEDIEDKKVIDMECIYEGSATWHQKDLHAQVIKMIKPDFTIVEASNINSTNTYSPGKYTLVVRIGGYHDDNSPVFMRMDNMDVKVVVNQLNLRNTSGDLIKIDRIPNNKVRLNIFGQSLSNVVSKVVLLKAPTKTEYELDEELNLSGGIIVPYLGDLAGEEIAITLNEVVNPNITSTSGEHQVELTYDGMTVVQEDEKFIINVSDVKQLVVNGEVKLGNKIVTSQFRGPGKYSRATSDKSVELVASEYLIGYIFNNWTSNSTYVKAASVNNYNTTFTVPKKSTTIDKEEVTITANYIAPKRLEITNQKEEFVVGEDFSLGEGILNAVYQKDNEGETKRQISLTTSGVTITLKDDLGNEYDLDNLKEGIYKVIIEFADVKIEYEIEVIRSKHALNVYTPSANYGEVNGSIKDAKGNIKDTIVISDDVTSVYKQVAYGRTVTLTANAEDGYVFAKWNVTGGTNLIPTENLSDNEITFIMPENDIIIEAVFTKKYTVKFKVQTGQESRGSLSGETTQYVLLGEETSPVTAVPSSNYGFIKWIDNEGRLISQDRELVCSYITSDAEYIAVFDSVWKVTFYNGDLVFRELEVVNGESGYIEEIPTKYGYVFTGWDKDLSNVTSNITTYAQYVPRINIEENTAPEINTIDANITGTMITEGTMQYMISSSAEVPADHYYTYKTDDIFTNIEGDWYNVEDYYRSKAITSGQDSSTILTISSLKSTEIVKFDYMLSATSDSHLGITINGIRVIGPDQTIPEGWNSFNQEVEVIGGEIKIGITYTQGAGNNDYAAIKNMAVLRRWIDIPNSYELLTPVEFTENYIHVRGRGSDDSVMYYAVSDVFIAEGAILDTYTVRFNSNGGSGTMASQTFTEGVSQELIENKFTKTGYLFAGWSSIPGNSAEYSNKGSYMATSDALLYAVWIPETPSVVITSIIHEGAILEGIYSNYICEECGEKNHICEVINVEIDAENAVVKDR